MNVGKRLAEIIADGGVQAVFGLPGGQTLPFYAATRDAGLRHVLVRDERSGACAADAYARIAGRVGFCDATVGPGVTNLVSGLAESFASSVPVIAVIADIRTDQGHLRQRASAAQAMDQAALLKPVTKWFGRVEHPDMLEPILDQALRVATTGRPGPVALEIPDDVFSGEMSAEAERRAFGPEAFLYPRFRPAPSPSDIARVVALVGKSTQPLILSGGGVMYSRSDGAVAELAQRHQIPVVTTLSGKGVVPDSNPLAGGVTGTFGTLRGNRAALEADLILVIGCKLGQLTTHSWKVPRPDQTVVHIDIDGEEIGRTIRTEIGIVADAREAADGIGAALAEIGYAGRNWLADLETSPPSISEQSDGTIHPQRLAAVLDEVLGDRDILVCDASLASGWGAAYVAARGPRMFVAPRGLAGLGHGAGAALRARMAAEPDQHVVMLAGDGAWGYSLGETETAARLDLDITYLILNNSGLGWVKHEQDEFGHEEKSIYSDANFAAAARALGASAVRVTNLEDFEAELRLAFATAGPNLLEAITAIDPSPVLTLASLDGGATGSGYGGR